MADKSQRPTAVGELLEGILGPQRFRQVKQQLALAAAWEEVAGPELAGKVRPIALSGGVLWLEADSPPYAQHAQLSSPDIIEAANRLLGEELVKEVRLRPAQSKPSGKS